MNDIVFVKNVSLEEASRLQGDVGGGWVDEMAHLLGKRGVVTEKDEMSNPTIFGFKWNPELVRKEHKVGTEGRGE